jgi:hypothetical protein
VAVVDSRTLGRGVVTVPTELMMADPILNRSTPSVARRFCATSCYRDLVL